MKKYLITILSIILICGCLVTTSYATDTNPEDTLIDDDTQSETDNTDETENQEPEQTEIEWTDVSNVTFEWDFTVSGNFQTPNIKLNNMTYKEDHGYYVYISNTKDTLDMENLDISNEGIKSISSEFPIISRVDSFYEVNKPIYVSLIESAYDETQTTRVYHMLIENQELARKPQASIGNRLQAYFFEDETSTFCYEPKSDEREESANINYKIGLVKDNDILRAIQNGESDCLERLMSYAKNDANGKTGTVKLGYDASILDKIDLIDDAYYYAYLELDDENGKYIPIEDVSLYQGSVVTTLSGKVDKGLFDYLSDDFVWNLSEEGGDITPDNNDNNNTPTPTPDDNQNEQDNTIAGGRLPQTGVTITLAFSIVILTIVGIIIYRKNKQMRDIK